MALGEFSLIERYFTRPLAADAGPGALGVGDDAAILPMPPGTKLVACKDVLVQGRHFFADVSPHSLGHKSLAVNLSDLAAMGATPMGCLLGLGLPSVDGNWLAQFSAGLNELASQWGCPLIGGDTVSSDKGIFISVTALGTLPVNEPGLLRSAARVGDDIWVSGPLGAPDIALKILLGTLGDEKGSLSLIRGTLEYPQPRVALGVRLLGLAHAAIDISDGLTQDLGHMLKASGVGAVLELDRLPAHPGLSAFDPALVQQAMLSGGDVYELCFTAAADRRGEIAAAGASVGLELARIGRIIAEPGLFAESGGELSALKPGGFDHFAGGDG